METPVSFTNRFGDRRGEGNGFSIWPVPAVRLVIGGNWLEKCVSLDKVKELCIEDDSPKWFSNEAISDADVELLSELACLINAEGNGAVGEERGRGIGGLEAVCLIINEFRKKFPFEGSWFVSSKEWRGFSTRKNIVVDVSDKIFTASQKSPLSYR